jgi:hypothetical protein
VEKGRKETCGRILEFDSNSKTPNNNMGHLPAAEGETMNSDQWIAAIIILGGLLAWGFVCGYWIGRLVERISKTKGA